HRKLITQLDELCNKHMMEEKPIYFEMLSFLKSWLRDHIQGVDTKYSAALQQSGFSVASWEREASAEFALMSASKKWWEVWKVA
ncbi:MAG: hemerythrin, partial [Gammaproteobacteria bacterium]|nr:hemerythrin [Gammaproteobacteria bacterium]